MDLSGKVALVTGAGAGLGEAIAVAFAKAGATLALLDLDGPAAERTLEVTGSPGTALAADVTDEAAVVAAVAAAEGEVGPVDILVNNAGISGIGGPKRLHETEPVEWERVLAVNLTGPYLMSRAVLPSMLARRTGVIVNVASAAGIAAFPGRSPYCATKAGLIHLTKTIAVEYARHGIRANALCPGWMVTGMTRWRLDDPEAAARLNATVPMGRVAQPAELAEAALYLASDSSRYMTGQNLVVDGGWTAPAAQPV